MNEFIGELPQLLVNGVTLGSIIALAAVGLTLTYGILRLANFAHGDFMTLGAYLTLVVSTPLLNWIGEGLNRWSAIATMTLSIALGAAATVAAMLLCEKLLWLPMRDRKATPTTLIIISIGLALVIRNGILFIWGGSNQPYQLPVPKALTLADSGFCSAIADQPSSLWQYPQHVLCTIRIGFYDIVTIVLAVGAIAALHLLLQKTKVGKAMRAVADNIDLARVSGINVERVAIWTWVVAGCLTALGGSLYGLITDPRPNMGWFLILPMFASVILGGIGNPYGAIAGAMVIGIAQEISIPLLGSEYKLGVALLIMALVLLFRPQGIFKGTM